MGTKKQLMTKQKKYLLPVLRSSELVGIISKDEMLEAITKGID